MWIKAFEEPESKSTQWILSVVTQPLDLQQAIEHVVTLEVWFPSLLQDSLEIME